MSVESAIVYGGSGFLGSHVADTLSDAGYSVRIFDRRPSPYIRSDQKMICGDLADSNSVVQAADGCSVFFNFAGIADIEEARDRPIETASLNVLGNVHALEAARINKARRFVFASSVYVYSESGSFYRASKQAAERFVEAYEERYGLNYTILRYGSLYGRRAGKRNSIYRMVSEALKTGIITYNGNPKAIREYIHVTDAAKLSLEILEEKYANSHMILTGQERLRVQDLMSMIAEMLPDPIEIRTVNPDRDTHYVMTPYAFHPKIGHKLVCRDTVDLGQGILDCLAEVHEQSYADESATDVPAKAVFEGG